MGAALVPYTSSRPTTVALLMDEMYSESGDGQARFVGGRLKALDHLGRDGESIDAFLAAVDETRYDVRLMETLLVHLQSP